MLWGWLQARSRCAAPLVFVAMTLLGVSACRSPVSLPPPVTDLGVGWLHTVGARVLAEDGSEHRIRAVSWFGLETEDCMPHGLGTITMDAALATIARLGFNTVRLPYSSQCLAASRSTGAGATLDPSLVGASPLQVMDLVVRRAGEHHLSVVLDRHRLGWSAQSDLWYDDHYPEQTWLRDWTMLAKRYRGNPTVIGADLQNEPHGAACWGCGEPSRDWAAAATRAGNAILAVNPRWLILVEGVAQQSSGVNAWWGGGLSDVRDHPIELQRSGHVVYAPHAYPPSIYDQSWFHDPTYPANLPGVWDRDWGYLQREGIAPVLLGEFGSKLRTGADRRWLDTMVGYLNEQRMGYGWWALNPDSSDTGGLLKKDWVTPERAKVAALAPLSAPLGPPPATTSPTSSAPATSLSSTPTASASATTEGSFGSASPSPASPGSPSSPRSPVPTPGPTSSPTGPGTLDVGWQPQSAWADGYVAGLALRATGAAVKGWTVSWRDDRAIGIENAWGASCRLAAARITCAGLDWGAWVPQGGAVKVGVQVRSSGPAPAAPALTVAIDHG